MKTKTLTKLGIGTVVVLVVLVATAGLLLSNGKTLGERHNPFKATTAFDFAAGSFADYVAFTKATIKSEREDNPTQDVVDNLASFILTPGPECPQDANGRYAKGIVLVHGLLDSTYNMRPIGEYFQSQCFYVQGVLLPGHATRPGDLLATSWEKWTEVTHFAATQLALHANTLFLAGHSIGGALSLLEGTQNPEVDALILFAPALAVTDTARFAGSVSLLGKIFPKAGWLDADKDDAVYRYESMSFSSVAETWALIGVMQEAIKQSPRQLPVFTVASMQDSTVLTPAILDYMASNTNPLSHTLLYSQEEIAAIPNTTIVVSKSLDQGILSLSHLGLMTPPTHPWFGRDGVYRSCGHYGNEENPRFVQCKNGERDFYGETTPGNIEEGVLERIAFNPYYDVMIEQISSFAAAVN
ncbi:MAG: alpha/beta fold hydrolase [Pseudomonadota bacterium]